MVSHARHESLGRMCRITFIRDGIFSSTSVVSSPSFEKCVPPQLGQISSGA